MSFKNISCLKKIQTISKLFFPTKQTGEILQITGTVYHQYLLSGLTSQPNHQRFCNSFYKWVDLYKIRWESWDGENSTIKQRIFTIVSKDEEKPRGFKATFANIYRDVDDRQEGGLIPRSLSASHNLPGLKNISRLKNNLTISKIFFPDVLTL